MNKRTKLLLRENNEAEKQLSAAAQQILTDIVVYLRTAPISLYRQESVRRDITQMLLDAEARGDDAQSVIGNDYQTFCDSVISEIPPLSASARVADSTAGHSTCHCRFAGDLADRQTIGICHRHSGMADTNRDRRGYTRRCAAADSSFRRRHADQPHVFFPGRADEQTAVCHIVSLPACRIMCRFFPRATSVYHALSACACIAAPVAVRPQAAGQKAGLKPKSPAGIPAGLFLYFSYQSNSILWHSRPYSPQSGHCFPIKGRVSP